MRARDAGMDVVYEGIRLTPVADRHLGRPGGRARDRPLDPVGLARRADPVGAARRWREAGVGDVPVVVGGIIPEADAAALREAGVAAVYTPKDWDLNRMMRDIIAPGGRAQRRRPPPALERSSRSAARARRPACASAT